MVKKIRRIGLKLRDISLDDLLDILERLELEIRRYLHNKLPPKTDYDLILSVEKNDVLTLNIDIGIIGEYEDIIDYKAIVNDTINYARRFFEKELKKYRVIEENTP